MDVDLRGPVPHCELGFKFGPDGVHTSVHASWTVDEHGVVTEETDQFLQFGSCERSPTNLG